MKHWPRNIGRGATHLTLRPCCEIRYQPGPGYVVAVAVAGDVAACMTARQLAVASFVYFYAAARVALLNLFRRQPGGQGNAATRNGDTAG